MAKVYIVTSGCYSDYGIEACFTTKEKAQEYINNSKKTKDYSYSDIGIEEYELDGKTDIVNVIHVFMTYTSPFSKNKHDENIDVRVDETVECDAFKYWGKAEIYGADCEILKIKRIANPNKDIEEEKKRVIKIAYDTVKRIKYLYEVENVKTWKGMKKRIEE